MSAEHGMDELPLDTAGTRLRRAREAAGRTRAEISTTTCIPERSLTALEEGRYGDLPARTYALGFARTYARAVGLDADQIAVALRKELDGGESEAAPATATFTPGDPARVPSARFAWIAGLAVLIVVIAGLIFWRAYYAPEEGLPSLLPESPAPSATPSTAPSQLVAPVGVPSMPASAAAGGTALPSSQSTVGATPPAATPNGVHANAAAHPHASHRPRAEETGPAPIISGSPAPAAPPLSAPASPASAPAPQAKASTVSE